MTYGPTNIWSQKETHKRKTEDPLTSCIVRGVVKQNLRYVHTKDTNHTVQIQNIYSETKKRSLSLLTTLASLGSEYKCHS